MNTEIVNFFSNNYLAIVTLLILILRIVPPEWAGFWKYNENLKEKGRAPRITVIHFILTSLLESVVRAFFLPLLATFGLKDTVSLVILLVVIFDIFIRRQISGAAVTLVGIGILTLYLEKLIQTGEHIEFFGKMLIWHKDKKTTTKNKDEI